MALPVLILGESGTGKSASLRNFPQDKVAVINVAGKPLPFRNKIESETTDDYMKVDKLIRGFSSKYPSIVVDDAQYLMANEFMRRATERGYDKFTDIAKNFWALVNMCKELPDQVIVYFFAHIERDQNGNEKIKTIGKLLDEKITVEGMFTIVLKTNVTDGQYSFLTQNNGHDTVKSPIGMFPTYAIDNDLYYVDQKIRNYYEMDGAASDEVMKAADKEKANTEVKKDESKKRSRKRKVDGEGTADKDNVSANAESEPAEEKPAKRIRKKRDPEPEPPADTGEPDMNEPEEPAEDMSGAKATYEKARRKSRRTAKADAAAEKAGEVAESGMDDMKDGEEVDVPFDEAPEPPVPETPRRRRRRKAE